MTNAMTNHSDTESLAAFVDGRLEREERDAVTKHLQTCEECQGFVREAAAFQQEEEAAAAARKPPRRTWWAVAAGVAVVVLGGTWFVLGPLHQRELEKDTQTVYAAMVKPGRKAEARFSGQMIYARWDNPRGLGDKNDLDEFALENAANELAMTAGSDQSPAGRRALALAKMTNPLEALAVLNDVPDRDRDAKTWNDIAAWQHRLGQEDAALASAERALQLDSKMPEALFTRAAILQYGNNPNAARAAWQAYLEVEPRGLWAEEARRKMDYLDPLQ